MLGWESKRNKREIRIFLLEKENKERLESLDRKEINVTKIPLLTVLWLLRLFWFKKPSKYSLKPSNYWEGSAPQPGPVFCDHFLLILGQCSTRQFVCLQDWTGFDHDGPNLDWARPDPRANQRARLSSEPWLSEITLRPIITDTITQAHTRNF